MNYKDLGDENEDERIRQIGEKTMTEKVVVGFVTDAEPPTKADRYIQELIERFPGIQVLARGNGPIAGTVWVKVGPPEKIQ